MASRDITKIDKTIMDNFYKLVHTQPNIRHTASCSTFKILVAMKKQDSQAFNEHLNYCVDRLVTGLASSRALARQGYATLLLEVLKKFQVSTERLFTLAQQNYGNISNETSKDNLLGYYLLINVVLESGNYKKSKQNSSYVDKMYSILRQLMDQKSYFDYPVSKLLTARYETFYEQMLAEIPPAAFGSDVRLTHTELLSLALCNKSRAIPQLANLSSADVLKMSEVLTGDKLKRRPLHPVWIEWSKTVMKFCPNRMAAYSKSIIRPNFFKPNHNDLAAMGLELTAKLMEDVDAPMHLNDILTDYIIRLLLVSMRTKNSLYKQCTEFLTSLNNTIKSQTMKWDESLMFLQRDIFIRFTKSPGSLTFDEDSKSHTLLNILNSCHQSALKMIVSYLIRVLDTKMNPSESKRVRPVIGKLIAHIMCRPQMSEESMFMSWLAKYLVINSMFSYVDPLAQDKSFWVSNKLMPLAESLDAAAKASLKNAFHATIGQIISTFKAQQRIETLGSIVDLIHQLIHSGAVGYLDSTGDITKSWQQFMVCFIEYRKFCEANNDPKILYPISSLYLLYGFQIVEHGLNFGDQLEELYKAAQEALKNDPSDGSWADIMTDHIISILSATECNPWIRKLCVSLFGSLLPHISETSIDLLCEVVRGPLDPDEDEDDEGEDECSDMEAAATHNSVGDDNEGSHMDDTEDEDDDESNQDGEAAAVADDEDDNVEPMDDTANHEEEEEYMDDEQMMRLDSVLADMFKLKRKKRQDPSFKLRCLDLIKKVVAKKRNDAEVIKKIMSTIVPLAAKCRKSVDTRPISNKIDSIIASRPKCS